ncbi:hypothetical protein [Mucilaginibacter sp.]|jgi:hypothetical protein|uniref:hypothetical protein n=1 Tax=Mucilaginibacter sp. TaxID=1882438 RepID=UPI002C16E831|nr:hypothetical protein [Mucilaginibacter sp.]HTI57410.1 hypothetical protein [Mucilaginibacter sp.]
MNLSQSTLLYSAIVTTIFINSNYQNRPTTVHNEVAYNDFKKSVNSYKNLLINHPTKDIGNYLFKLIDEDIYNYWSGTPWDFYGTTQQPKTGSIACGYFVTNTLTDLGFKIDRIGLAEVRSGDMIKKLCVGIKSFNSLNKLNRYLAEQPANSIFIIGLDFHTGYIIKNSTGCYFFHSNYVKKEGVIKEKINVSKALSANKFFMIGSLTTNKKLLRKWVAGKPVI